MSMWCDTFVEPTADTFIAATCALRRVPVSSTPSVPPLTSTVRSPCGQRRRSRSRVISMCDDAVVATTTTTVYRFIVYMVHHVCSLLHLLFFQLHQRVPIILMLCDDYFHYFSALMISILRRCGGVADAWWCGRRRSRGSSSKSQIVALKRTPPPLRQERYHLPSGALGGAHRQIPGRFVVLQRGLCSGDSTFWCRLRTTHNLLLLMLLVVTANVVGLWRSNNRRGHRLFQQRQTTTPCTAIVPPFSTAPTHGNDNIDPPHDPHPKATTQEGFPLLRIRILSPAPAPPPSLNLSYVMLLKFLFSSFFSASGQERTGVPAATGVRFSPSAHPWIHGVAAEAILPPIPFVSSDDDPEGECLDFVGTGGRGGDRDRVPLYQYAPYSGLQQLGGPSVRQARWPWTEQVTAATSSYPLPSEPRLQTVAGLTPGNPMVSVNPFHPLPVALPAMTRNDTAAAFFMAQRQWNTTYQVMVQQAMQVANATNTTYVPPPIPVEGIPYLNNTNPLGENDIYSDVDMEGVLSALLPEIIADVTTTFTALENRTNILKQQSSASVPWLQQAWPQWNCLTQVYDRTTPDGVTSTAVEGEGKLAFRNRPPAPPLTQWLRRHRFSINDLKVTTLASDPILQFSPLRRWDHVFKKMIVFYRCQDQPAYPNTDALDDNNIPNRSVNAISWGSLGSNVQAGLPPRYYTAVNATYVPSVITDTNDPAYSTQATRFPAMEGRLWDVNRDTYEWLAPDAAQGYIDGDGTSDRIMPYDTWNKGGTLTGTPPPPQYPGISTFTGDAIDPPLFLPDRTLVVFWNTRLTSGIQFNFKGRDQRVNTFTASNPTAPAAVDAKIAAEMNDPTLPTPPSDSNSKATPGTRLDSAFSSASVMSRSALLFLGSDSFYGGAGVNFLHGTLKGSLVAAKDIRINASVPLRTSIQSAFTTASTKLGAPLVIPGVTVLLPTNTSTVQPDGGGNEKTPSTVATFPADRVYHPQTSTPSGLNSWLLEDHYLREDNQPVRFTGAFSFFDMQLVATEVVLMKCTVTAAHADAIQLVTVDFTNEGDSGTPSTALQRYISDVNDQLAAGDPNRTFGRVMPMNHLAVASYLVGTVMTPGIVVWDTAHVNNRLAANNAAADFSQVQTTSSVVTDSTVGEGWSAKLSVTLRLPLYRDRRRKWTMMRGTTMLVFNCTMLATNKPMPVLQSVYRSFTFPLYAPTTPQKQLMMANVAAPVTYRFGLWSPSVAAKFYQSWSLAPSVVILGGPSMIGTFYDGSYLCGADGTAAPSSVWSDVLSSTTGVVPPTDPAAYPMNRNTSLPVLSHRALPGYFIPGTVAGRQNFSSYMIWFNNNLTATSTMFRENETLLPPVKTPSYTTTNQGYYLRDAMFQYLGATSATGLGYASVLCFIQSSGMVSYSKEVVFARLSVRILQQQVVANRPQIVLAVPMERILLQLPSGRSYYVVDPLGTYQDLHGGVGGAGLVSRDNTLIVLGDWGSAAYVGTLLQKSIVVSAANGAAYALANPTLSNLFNNRPRPSMSTTPELFSTVPTSSALMVFYNSNIQAQTQNYASSAVFVFVVTSNCRFFAPIPNYDAVYTTPVNGGLTFSLPSVGLQVMYNNIRGTTYNYSAGVRIFSVFATSVVHGPNAQLTAYSSVVMLYNYNHSSLSEFGNLRATSTLAFGASIQSHHCMVTMNNYDDSGTVAAMSVINGAMLGFDPDLIGGGVGGVGWFPTRIVAFQCLFSMSVSTSRFGTVWFASVTGVLVNMDRAFIAVQQTPLSFYISDSTSTIDPSEDAWRYRTRSATFQIGIATQFCRMTNSSIMLSSNSISISSSQTHYFVSTKVNGTTPSGEPSTWGGQSSVGFPMLYVGQSYLPYSYPNATLKMSFEERLSRTAWTTSVDVRVGVISNNAYVFGRYPGLAAVLDASTTFRGGVAPPGEPTATSWAAAREQCTVCFLENKISIYTAPYISTDYPPWDSERMSVATLPLDSANLMPPSWPLGNGAQTYDYPGYYQECYLSSHIKLPPTRFVIMPGMSVQPVPASRARIYVGSMTQQAVVQGSAAVYMVGNSIAVTTTPNMNCVQTKLALDLSETFRQFRIAQGMPSNGDGRVFGGSTTPADSPLWGRYVTSPWGDLQSTALFIGSFVTNPHVIGDSALAALVFINNNVTLDVYNISNISTAYVMIGSNVSTGIPGNFYYDLEDTLVASGNGLNALLQTNATLQRIVSSAKNDYNYSLAWPTATPPGSYNPVDMGAVFPVWPWDQGEGDTVVPSAAQSQLYRSGQGYFYGVLMYLNTFSAMNQWYTSCPAVALLMGAASMMPNSTYARVSNMFTSQYCVNDNNQDPMYPDGQQFLSFAPFVAKYPRASPEDFINAQYGPMAPFYGPPWKVMWGWSPTPVALSSDLFNNPFEAAPAPTSLSALGIIGCANSYPVMTDYRGLNTSMRSELSWLQFSQQASVWNNDTQEWQRLPQWSAADALSPNYPDNNGTRPVFPLYQQSSRLATSSTGKYDFCHFPAVTTASVNGWASVAGKPTLYPIAAPDDYSELALAQGLMIPAVASPARLPGGTQMQPVSNGSFSPSFDINLLAKATSVSGRRPAVNTQYGMLFSESPATSLCKQLKSSARIFASYALTVAGVPATIMDATALWNRPGSITAGVGTFTWLAASQGDIQLTSTQSINNATLTNPFAASATSNGATVVLATKNYSISVVPSLAYFIGGLSAAMMIPTAHFLFRRAFYQPMYQSVIGLPSSRVEDIYGNSNLGHSGDGSTIPVSFSTISTPYDAFTLQSAAPAGPYASDPMTDPTTQSVSEVLRRNDAKGSSTLVRGQAFFFVVRFAQQNVLNRRVMFFPTNRDQYLNIEQSGAPLLGGPGYGGFGTPNSWNRGLWSPEMYMALQNISMMLPLTLGTCVGSSPSYSAFTSAPGATSDVWSEMSTLINMRTFTLAPLPSLPPIVGLAEVGPGLSVNAIGLTSIKANAQSTSTVYPAGGSINVNGFGCGSLPVAAYRAALPSSALLKPFWQSVASKRFSMWSLSNDHLFGAMETALKDPSVPPSTAAMGARNYFNLSNPPVSRGGRTVLLSASEMASQLASMVQNYSMRVGMGSVLVLTWQQLGNRAGSMTAATVRSMLGPLAGVMDFLRGRASGPGNAKVVSYSATLPTSSLSASLSSSASWSQTSSLSVSHAQTKRSHSFKRPPTRSVTAPKVPPPVASVFTTTTVATGVTQTVVAASAVAGAPGSAVTLQRFVSLAAVLQCPDPLLTPPSPFSNIFGFGVVLDTYKPPSIPPLAFNWTIDPYDRNETWPATTSEALYPGYTTRAMTAFVRLLANAYRGSALSMMIALMAGTVLLGALFGLIAMNALQMLPKAFLRTTKLIQGDDEDGNGSGLHHPPHALTRSAASSSPSPQELLEDDDDDDDDDHERIEKMRHAEREALEAKQLAARIASVPRHVIVAYVSRFPSTPVMVTMMVFGQIISAVLSAAALDDIISYTPKVYIDPRGHAIQNTTQQVVPPLPTAVMVVDVFLIVVTLIVVGITMGYIFYATTGSRLMARRRMVAPDGALPVPGWVQVFLRGNSDWKALKDAPLTERTQTASNEDVELGLLPSAATVGGKQVVVHAPKALSPVPLVTNVVTPQQDDVYYEENYDFSSETRRYLHCHKTIIDDYVESRPWYSAVDLGMSTIAGVIGSIRSSNPSVCTAALFSMVALQVAAVVVLLVLRPHASWFNLMHAIVLAILAAVASICALFTPSRPYSDSLTVAAMYLMLLRVAIDFVIWFAKLCVKMRRRLNRFLVERQKKRRTAMVQFVRQEPIRPIDDHDAPLLGDLLSNNGSFVPGLPRGVLQAPPSPPMAPKVMYDVDHDELDKLLTSLTSDSSHGDAGTMLQQLGKKAELGEQQGAGGGKGVEGLDQRFAHLFGKASGETSRPPPPPPPTRQSIKGGPAAAVAATVARSTASTAVEKATATPPKSGTASAEPPVSTVHLEELDGGSYEDPSAAAESPSRTGEAPSATPQGSSTPAATGTPAPAGASDVQWTEQDFELGMLLGDHEAPPS